MALCPPLLPPPSEAIADGTGKWSTFIMNEILPDPSYSLFGKNSIDRSYKIVIDGLITWRSSPDDVQTMPKFTVQIPTLFQPLTLSLKIVTTVDEDSETWIGFFLQVDNICTLKIWEDNAYFTLKIRSAYAQKRARYVQYSPVNNCWGWTKHFRRDAMIYSNKGNPFLLSIILEHEPMPCIHRFPASFISTEDFENSPDQVDNFRIEWAKRIAAETKKNAKLERSTSSQGDRKESKASKKSKKRTVSAGEIRSTSLNTSSSQGSVQQTQQNHKKNRRVRT